MKVLHIFSSIFFFVIALISLPLFGKEDTFLKTSDHFFLQGRFYEGYTCIQKILSSEENVLSLKEKTQITALLSKAEIAIAAILEKADRQCEQGFYEKALSEYARIFPVFEGLFYPYQASSLEKKRYKDIICLRMAEILFCLGKFSESSSYIHKIKKNHLLQKQLLPIYTRYLSLLSLLMHHEKNHPLHNAQGLLQNVNSSKIPIQMYLFRIQRYLKDHNLAKLQSISKKLHVAKEYPLANAVSGLNAYIEKDYIRAYKHLSNTLSTPLCPYILPFYETILTAYADTCFKRGILLQHTGDIQTLNNMLSTLSSFCLLSSSEKTRNYSQSIIHFFKKPAIFTNVFSPIATSTKIFSPYNDLDLQQYFAACKGYQKVLDQNLSPRKTISLLRKLLSKKSLADGKPYLLKALIDLYSQSGNIEEVYALLQELLLFFPSHPKTAEAAFAALTASENHPGSEEIRKQASAYLLSLKKENLYTFFTCLHLCDCYHQICTPENTTLLFIENSLVAREEARNFRDEGKRHEEPGLVKNFIEKSTLHYNHAIALCIKAISSCTNAQLTPLLYGFLFATREEKIQSLLYHIETHSAFNELPTLLLEETDALKKDLDKNSLSFLQKNRCNILFALCASSEVMAYGFLRKIDLAIKSADLASSYVQSSPSMEKALLYLGKILRTEKMYAKSLFYLEKVCSPSLRFEAAIEKSLCFQELSEYDTAFALLGAVINDPEASCLRMKAMMYRAELYMLVHRKDLATRQLEALQSQDEQWAFIAKQKLQDLYGYN